MDFGALLSDPNFLQYLGNAGATIGSGGSVGEALNPSSMIRQGAVQDNNMEMLKALMAYQQQDGQSNQTQVPPASGATMPVSPATALPTETPLQLSQGQPRANSWERPGATPIGAVGPDAVNTKETADKITTTIVEPTQKNLNTFGPSVPPESVTQQGGNMAPFFKALLS